jgi:CRISPR-associated endonuclease/helicase Cas3
MNRLPTFLDFFKSLWGDAKEPFPWQTMLADRVSSEGWPDVIDLPTAAGKTACLDIAVYGLAAQAERPLGERTAARRVWFVVDRRIVVDEAFDRARILAEKLGDDAAPPAVRSIAHRLLAIRGLPSRERPLAVGRLRGGVLRDDGWARIPSQAAIITSTVDQLGSRLLFSSYGDSALAAPIYAGLAGNDSLILLDEAHCAVPFLQTLRAVQMFRSLRWSEVENPTPFHATVLSATPPREGNEAPLKIFPDESERERALANGALQLRLQASKKVALRNVSDEVALSKELALVAAEFVQKGKRRIGVMVNRVGRAYEIAAILRSEIQKVNVNNQRPFDVELLTGRIRPVERDFLVGKGARLHRILRSFQAEEPARPLVLVATQCLEVGADFSFDALATECASVDALRQRFGRLDRLGTYSQSPGVILVADSQLKEPDPIYGEAIKSTWECLQSIATVESAGTKNETRIVDFGVSAIGPLLPTGEDVKPLLAPAPNAPILLPAHLDLFCQTAPHPAPDLYQFLHGKGRAVPEVRVVWRCDLVSLPPERWLEVVSLCRPVTGEMLSVPLHRFRQWLRNRNSADLTGDVESATHETDEERPRQLEATQFLVWRGRDRSEISSDPDKIRPDSVVVLPVPFPSEAATLGQTLRERGFGRLQLDLWELAWQSAGRPTMLRVNRACLEQWLETCPPLRDLLELVENEWTVGDLRDSLAAVQHWTGEDENSPALPEWLSRLFAEVKDFKYRDVERHPGGGLILRAAAKRNDEEPDFFADDDDELSEAPDFVLLETHAADVERTATQLADACLGDTLRNLFKITAQWHDVGKVDPRFQMVLWGGIPGFEKPLAKSPNLPRSRERASSIYEAADLPKGFRHEMLSLQVAERFAVTDLTSEDRDLFLHLIASHHGHARPFAPVCEDCEPGALHAKLGRLQIDVSTEERKDLMPVYLLHSGVSDRFWSLTRRFGWWGIAYLEAILRLADWYASAKPGKAENL